MTIRFFGVKSKDNQSAIDLDNQYGEAEKYLEKYSKSNFEILNFNPNENIFPFFPETQPNTLPKRKERVNTFISKSGSVEDIKKSVDRTNFFIPSLTLVVERDVKDKFNFDAKPTLSKHRSFDNIGRGETSYRPKSEFVKLEDNMLANFTVNRTQTLIPFGARGSICTIVSDDEQNELTEDPDFRNRNRIGSVIDDIADDDNITDYDLVTLSKYGAVRYGIQKSQAINRRLNFLNKKKINIGKATSIKVENKININPSLEEIQFEEIDFVHFSVVCQILSTLTITSSFLKENESFVTCIGVVQDIISHVASHPKQNTKIFLTIQMAKFISILLAVSNVLSKELYNDPTSEFRLMVEFTQKGFSIEDSSFNLESSRIAAQVDNGGQLFAEITALRDLSFMLDLADFSTNVSAMLEYYGASDADLASVVEECDGADLLEMSVKFTAPHNVVMTGKIYKSTRSVSIMPIWNMFDYYSKKVEGDSIPW